MLAQTNQTSSDKSRELLLVLPVPFLIKNNQIFFEAQACNGLARWLDNFESLIVAAPQLPESLAQAHDKSFVWIDTATLPNQGRFELVPLPWAYSLTKFLRHYFPVRSQLAHLIKRCQYLQFAIGGLWGDWGAIAALEAHQQKRTFAIHTDRVEHLVLLETNRELSLIKRMKAQIASFLMAQYHRKIIQNCTLGLWHGHDCYNAYNSFCQNNFLIHNIHLKSSDHILPEQLSIKVHNALSEPKLRICYAGRIEAMKAPLDWVKAIKKARELGVELQATWLGEGSLYQEMKSLIEEFNLEDCIELTGFQSNREKLLNTIQQSHLMLFTHVTPESPRCLLESLGCGTPIIGYYSAYAADLIKNDGGGQLVPVRNWEELSILLLELFKDRQLLSQLIQEAAHNGKHFTDQAVFRERSELIKHYLV